MCANAHANTGLMGRACVREVPNREVFPQGPPGPTRSTASRYTHGRARWVGTPKVAHKVHRKCRLAPGAGERRAEFAPAARQCPNNILAKEHGA